MSVSDRVKTKGMDRVRVGFIVRIRIRQKIMSRVGFGICLWIRFGPVYC